MSFGIQFNLPVNHREVPAGGWATWSHGYTGDVYATFGGALSRTITLPTNTRAFYLYIEGTILILSTLLLQRMMVPHLVPFLLVDWLVQLIMVFTQQV
ncbi:MAG: hypothetical protein U0T81_14620 [Saprospiraceae bacterium]